MIMMMIKLTQDWVKWWDSVDSGQTFDLCEASELFGLRVDTQF
jgi:hypothetical protein